MTASPSRVWTRIDFGADGVQSDAAHVPISTDSSAYGVIPVPMICIRNGSGPTALLTAGTHGDEYEGQIALLRLARDLARDLAQVRLSGRVILLPALNRPAVLAGRRNSPLDGGNLNRVFPGDPEGGPTDMIAHYVASELFPRADLVIDLHSGGSSLDYLPMALARPGRDETARAAQHRLLKSFAAPLSVITTGSGGGAGATLYAAAEARGLPAITTELGGGPTLGKQGLAIAETGLRRVLSDYGIADGLGRVAAGETIFMKSLGPAHSIFAPHDGLFEPEVAPGTAISAGDLAGWLHRLDDPMQEPTPLRFHSDGTVSWRRFPTLTTQGDALFGLITAP